MEPLFGRGDLRSVDVIETSRGPRLLTREAIYQGWSHVYVNTYRLRLFEPATLEREAQVIYDEREFVGQAAGLLWFRRETLDQQREIHARDPQTLSAVAVDKLLEARPALASGVRKWWVEAEKDGIGVECNDGQRFLARGSALDLVPLAVPNEPLRQSLDASRGTFEAVEGSERWRLVGPGWRSSQDFLEPRLIDPRTPGPRAEPVFLVESQDSLASEHGVLLTRVEAGRTLWSQPFPDQKKILSAFRAGRTLVIGTSRGRGRSDSLTSLDFDRGAILARQGM